MSSHPPVRPRTPQKEGKNCPQTSYTCRAAHRDEHQKDNNALKKTNQPSITSPMLLQGRQQQRGADPGGGQQERSAAAAVHASQGGVRPGEEDLEVWLCGVLCQVQLARGPALQRAAGHRRVTRHAPEPHRHPAAGGATEEPLHHHVTPRALSGPLASGVERKWRIK